MRAVNLLPREAFRERRSLQSVLPFVGASAVPVIVLSLLVVGYSSQHSAVTAKEGQLAALRAQTARLAPARLALPSTSGLVDERTQRRAALDDVLGKEMPWDTTLRDVARVLPANVWLSDLTATSPTPADSAATPAPAGSSTATPTSFTINGYTYSEEDVAFLLARLQLLPTLSDVALVSTARSMIGKKSVVQFQVTAVVSPGHVGAQTR